MNSSKRAKIGVIGAGNVGATAAHLIALKDLADVALIDIADGIPTGKALDILQSAPVEAASVDSQGGNSYELIRGADIVIVTAGIPRKPGMSRDDLLKTNAGIVESVSKQVAEFAPQSTLIVVSNPLDAMCHVALKASGFPKERVMGMAGVLDTARYRAFLSTELGISAADIHALLLGGHGDTMVPLPRYTTVQGIPISNFISEKRLNEIIERTKAGGAEIVGYLKTGSAFYAPAASAVEMAEVILKDQKKLRPVCAYLDGQFGFNNIYMGVPVILGAKGVEKIIEVPLDEKEKALLKNSYDSVRGLVDSLGL